MVEPPRPFGGVFNSTGSMEGPPCAQPGRHWSHGSHGPGTRISETDWESQGKRKCRYNTVWDRSGAFAGPYFTGPCETNSSSPLLCCHGTHGRFAQQPVGRCGTSIHPHEDRQFNVMDLTVKQCALCRPPAKEVSTALTVKQLLWRESESLSPP